MKKIFEKVVSITLGIISLFFVILMLVTAFGALTIEDFDNSIVRALLICLAVIFAVLTGLAIFAAFQDNEKLSSVILFKNKESATKATVGVVKRTAKRVVKTIPEAKISKVQILADDNGNVRLKVDAKLKTNATMDVVTKVRAMLIDTFDSIFGIEFASIDFRIVKSKNDYVPTNAAVDKKVAELKATVEQNKPEHADAENATSETATSEEAEAATPTITEEEIITSEEAPIEITGSADIIGIIPQGGENVDEENAPAGADEANNDNTAAEQEVTEAPNETEEVVEEDAEEAEDAPVTEAAEELPLPADEEGDNN